eukprot:6176355-Pleurochrysis_carterae.AAC.3
MYNLSVFAWPAGPCACDKDHFNREVDLLVRSALRKQIYVGFFFASNLFGFFRVILLVCVCYDVSIPLVPLLGLVLCLVPAMHIVHV